MLAVLLEMLRKAARFYDKHIIRAHDLRAVSRATDGHNFPTDASFRPSIWQQGVRTLFYMLQIVVAFWIMNFADYRNGYVLICVAVGVFIGAFIFRWERIGGSRQGLPSSSVPYMPPRSIV